MDLLSLCQRLVSTQSQEKYSAICAPDGTPGTVAEQVPIIPGSRYLQFRLSQMYLKDSRVLWSQYIPMVIAVIEFMYDRKKETIPVYLGNNLLEVLGDITANEAISFKNTNILGPAPYMGGEVAFFLGFFRVKASDLSEGLFNLAETLIGPFSKAPLSSYVTVARSFKNGLSGLLGLDEVNMQMGNRTEFTDMEEDPYSLREGYLVYINAPAGQIHGDGLRIRDDRLYTFGRDKSHHSFDEHDFCLVKIACPEKRRDFRTLGFTRIYDDAVDEIYKGNFDQSKYVFQRLMQEINRSPDLIRTQKIQLIKLYKANLEVQKELLHGTGQKTASENGKAMRGAAASKALGLIAYTAKINKMDRDVEKGIKKMAENMDQIIGEIKPKGLLSDHDLGRQLDRLDSISPPGSGDPDDFIKAISISHSVDRQHAPF